MGAAFSDIPGDPAPPGILESATDGIVFVVCRVESRGKDKPRIIHLQGVAADHKTAVAMCRDRNYFIGPIPVNVLFPEGRMEWIGIEYPLRKKRNVSGNPTN